MNLNDAVSILSLAKAEFVRFSPKTETLTCGDTRSPTSITISAAGILPFSRNPYTIELSTLKEISKLNKVSISMADNGIEWKSGRSKGVYSFLSSDKSAPEVLIDKNVKKSALEDDEIKFVLDNTPYVSLKGQGLSPATPTTLVRTKSGLIMGVGYDFSISVVSSAKKLSEGDVRLRIVGTTIANLLPLLKQESVKVAQGTNSIYVWNKNFQARMAISTESPRQEIQATFGWWDKIRADLDTESTLSKMRMVLDHGKKGTIKIEGDKISADAPGKSSSFNVKTDLGGPFESSGALVEEMFSRIKSFGGTMGIKAQNTFIDVYAKNDTLSLYQRVAAVGKTKGSAGAAE